jgi:hypothetical protein
MNPNMSRRVGVSFLAVGIGIAACSGQTGVDNSGHADAGGAGAPDGSSSGSSSGGAPDGSTSGSSSGGDASANACTSLPTLTRRLWRLSAEQWGAAVQDLLGLPTAPVLTARGGEADSAFFSDVSLQVDPDMLYDMYELAEAATDAIDAQVGTTIAPCTGTTAADQTVCAQSFIQSFAATAYRQPVDSTEVSDLMALYALGEDYPAGIELMIQGVLLAPSFLYRTELGPPSVADANGHYPDTTLTPYEVATQLGFTLLGSLPDAELTAAAADGSLGTPAGIQQQVQRLLGLPAVQANLPNIILGWFNVNQVYAKVHDTSLLSALPVADQDQTVLENDLETSTRDWVSSILWQGSGKIDDLLTSQTVYVNQRLATLYPDLSFNGQPPADDTTFVAATWPQSEGRSGLLTQPSWLWAQSDPSLMSIIKRGEAIHDNIVCADPLPPPVDLTTPQAVNVIGCKSPDGTTTLSACNTEEEQSQARTTYQPCKSCHDQLDPYALVLDDFGPIGNYQALTQVEQDAGLSPTGGPADTTATFSSGAPEYGDADGGPLNPPVLLPGSPLAPQTLTGAHAFATALIATGHFDGCSVQQIASYAIGTPIATYSTCELELVRASIDGSVQSLFTQVLMANFMRARAGGTQ